MKIKQIFFLLFSSDLNDRKSREIDAARVDALLCFAGMRTATIEKYKCDNYEWIKMTSRRLSLSSCVVVSFRRRHQLSSLMVSSRCRHRPMHVHQKLPFSNEVMVATRMTRCTNSCNIRLRFYAFAIIIATEHHVVIQAE